MAKRGRPKKKVEEKVEVETKVEEIQEKEPEGVEKPEIIEPEVPPEPKREPPPEPKKEDEHPREKLLSFDEVARGFGIAEHLVDTWVERKGLVSVNVGGVRMITYNSVMNCPFKRYR